MIEGNHIIPTGTTSINTDEECETLCGQTNGCQSFKYCPNDPPAIRCWMRDKKIAFNEKIGPIPNCFTAYKSCESGKTYSN